MPIAPYYLGANSATPATSTFNRPQSMSQASLPNSPASPPPNQASRVRASMPPPSRAPPSSAFVNQPSSASVRPSEPTVEEHDENDPDTYNVSLERTTSTPAAEKRKSRNGSMNKEFKFPPSSPVTPSSVLAASASKSASPPDAHPQGALNETQNPHSTYPAFEH